MDLDKMARWIERYETSRFRMNQSLNAIIKQQIDPQLTLEQFSLLCNIYKSKGGCTPTELADYFCVNKSAITAMITRLENKGLIERVRDSTDRRVVYLSLTSLGHEVCEMGRINITEQLSRYLSQFSEDEIEMFMDSFEKLAELMQQDRKE
ncbi:MarR family winged helix-turn-helix transcriptional regulator [Paenibacillus senegalensis]|uniref:MarR family winged helix-turn-helix transcriptional regulator n=1 Tax=Paenibacillus senegalensis TaxID=1465766 RepID=UPI000288C40E|nr:MarR family transcriptional regulator [Paenibacillus senegalensis]